MFVPLTSKTLLPTTKLALKETSFVIGLKLKFVTVAPLCFTEIPGFPFTFNTVALIFILLIAIVCGETAGLTNATIGGGSISGCV